MINEPFDTHPDAELVQVELLRRATGIQRFGIARTLTATTRHLAWRAIKRAHPEATDEEIDFMFIAVHYGQDLADRVRDYLATRR